MSEQHRPTPDPEPVATPLRAKPTEGDMPNMQDRERPEHKLGQSPIVPKAQLTPRQRQILDVLVTRGGGLPVPYGARRRPFATLRALGLVTFVPFSGGANPVTLAQLTDAGHRWSA